MRIQKILSYKLSLLNFDVLALPFFIKTQRRITQMLYLSGYSKEKIGKQVYFNGDAIIILSKGVIIR